MNRTLFGACACGALLLAGGAASAQNVDIYADPTQVNKSVSTQTSRPSTPAPAARERSKDAAKYDILQDVDDEDEDDNLDKLFSDDAPGEYTVRRGDTLWGISQTQFGNPWEWPRVWSFNPAITNPHWIHPGEKLKLVSQATPDAPEGGPAPVKVRQRLNWKGGRPPMDAGKADGRVLVRAPLFIGTGDEKDLGQIVGSKEEKLLLTPPDEVYVSFSPEKPLKAGDRYTLFRTIRTITHPVTKLAYGQAVAIVGEVRVDQITKGNIARGVLLDAAIPIERGDRARPLERRVREITPKQNAKRVDSLIIDIIVGTTNAGRIASNQTMVFLDKGKSDGVQVGNRFLVLRHGDGYKKTLENILDEDDKYPPETIAEIMVADVKDNSSLGFVTTVRKEIVVGDRVVMRQGY